jgi:FkbM family methyltransferase
MGLQKNIYIAWLQLTSFLRKRFGIKTYGIGWTAAKVDQEFLFEFNGVPFKFLPKAARSYCLLPAGIPNEPETHKFLTRVLDTKRDVILIDVGASVGEFAIPMAHDPRVARVFAFEPHPATADALRASSVWVPAGKIQVIQKGVAAKAGFAHFDLNERAPTGAGLRDSDDNSRNWRIELCSLDDILMQCFDGHELVVLIDIEGGELDALRGGMKLISRYHPLIIFEYNATTRRYFHLDEAEDLLGEAYSIHRLRSVDGRLDSDLSDTWNVVALPRKGTWAQLRELPDLIVG